MCPTTCAKPPGELRADPGVDPPLASARQAGYAITPRFAPTSTPGLLEAVQRLRAEFPDTGCRRISVKTGRRSLG